MKPGAIMRPEVEKRNRNAFNKFKSEVEPYKDTLVIASFEVVKLVEVIDGKEDFYWVFDTWKGTVHSSCLMEWTPLKGIIDDKDYDEMVRVWNLNKESKVN